MASEETFLEAIERRGHRERWARGLPLRVALTRHIVGIDYRPHYLPAMASPNGRQWWVIAYWHRLQVGPIVVAWRKGADAK